jgi:DeoR/GlpR family transcriptional regulator of sugar metabolism
MNIDERRTYIISLVETGKSVDIKELAEELNVSEMTIRRDLTSLEKTGVVRRFFGGAVSTRGRSYEPPLLLRNTLASKAKTAIGKRASEMIIEGDCVALDVGSTTFEIARNLTGRNNLTVITPSLFIANLLVSEPGIRVILPGGILRHGEASIVGDLAQTAFKGLFVDKLFLGVGGIDAQAGLTEYNWDDTLVKKAMIHSAKQVIAVVDSSKFERVAFVQIGNFNDIHHLVTDEMPPSLLRGELEKSEVTIHIVKN